MNERYDLVDQNGISEAYHAAIESKTIRCDWCDCEVESRDQLTDASTLRNVGPREFVGDICQSCLLRHGLESLGACEDALAFNWSPDCDCDACTSFRSCL